MNSYPIEFLAHPQPLMFVAGLAPPRRASDTGTGAGTPSPPPTGDALPLMSPPLASEPLPVLSDGAEAEFAALQGELRAIFARFSTPGRVWVPESERKAFRVVLVDKGVRLPLRKMTPEPGRESHSPLSPLTPASPLYPDGLIAPIWIRKHAELVPSVFVLFLRLYETPPRDAGPAGANALGDEVLASFEKEREREADEALVKEISERRQRLNDRGIKLTVVCMASAATLESPGLDQRLSQIRRASQLSAKASLFVLTPVPANELPDFVRSLHDALYDSAVEYYAAHGKRVRRKRGRGGGGAKENAGRARAGSISLQSKALGQQGWMVRYDFKAGWFAEVRGDLDLARRHYEDCWNELAKMFSSTTILPPRTKRWAEAKVLADCVAARICRLLMYENAGPRVLIPFYVHLRRFGELCRGWGIGEETFEFWSWVARQYRLLGEMLDIATQNGFVVPPLPAPTYPAPSNIPQLDALLPNSSNNDMHILQPPAFYFYAAACCTIERKARLDAALEAEERGGTALTAAPGFGSEKKVNHSALIVELLTTAFNLLKDGGQEESGLALYVAFKTAQVHAGAGEHELALRFLDRLADKFESENWNTVLSQIRSLEYACSQAAGNVETAARLLVEMLAPNSGVYGEERDGLQDDLLNLLKTTVPSSSDPVVLSFGEEGFLNVSAGFRLAKAPSGSPVPFQVRVSVPDSVDISKIEFASLRVSFGDNRPDIIVTNGGDARVVNVGTVEADVETTAPLKFGRGESLIISGELVSSDVGHVDFSETVVCLSYGSWNIELRPTPQPLSLWTAGGKVFAPLKGIFPSVDITNRPHDVKFAVDAAKIAFVDEASSVVVRVTSSDTRDLSLSLRVEILDPESATLSYGDTTDVVIKDVPVKLVDGAGEATLVLKSAQSGSVSLDVSLCSIIGDDRAEITDTTVVQFMSPFECTPSISRSGRFATVSAVISVPARSVRVSALDITAAAEGVTLLSSSISAAHLPAVWDTSSAFALAARFELEQVVQRLSAPPGSAAVLSITWRPADSDSDETTTTIAFPPLAPVPPEAFVTSTLSAPAIVASHTPFALSLAVSNAHPTEPAFVAVAGDTADGFVWTGPRGVRLGPILPGQAASAEFELISVGSAGWQALPHVSVWHGEGQDRREIRVGLPSDRPAGTVLVKP